MIHFRRIVSSITIIENIAVSGSIKDIKRLRRVYGGRRWRKGKALLMLNWSQVRFD